MPARDRTDAVDWSAVEALLVEVLNAAHTGDRRILFEQRDVAPATHALAAVNLVRALEEGKVTSLVLLGARGVNRWVASRSHGSDAGPLYSADTPLAAVTRALDASKGEG